MQTKKLFTILGLQMWLNMRPYTLQKYGAKAVPYTLGTSSDKNGFDQKRNLIYLKPGHHVSVKVLPKLIQTSEEFNELGIELRKCKLPHEIDAFDFLKQYTRKGCEFECAAKRALSVCKCLPWYLPNNKTTHLMCDMFGGHCFDKIISDEAEYKKCSAHCLEDCQEIGLTVWHSSYPLNLEDVCKKGRFLDQHLESTFSQQFAFDGYKTLVEGGSLPEPGVSTLDHKTSRKVALVASRFWHLTGIVPSKVRPSRKR